MEFGPMTHQIRENRENNYLLILQIPNYTYKPPCTYLISYIYVIIYSQSFPLQSIKTLHNYIHIDLDNHGKV